jgi:hypothetical protein
LDLIPSYFQPIPRQSQLLAFDQWLFIGNSPMLEQCGQSSPHLSRYRYTTPSPTHCVLAWVDEGLQSIFLTGW